MNAAPIVLLIIKLIAIWDERDMLTALSMDRAQLWLIKGNWLVMVMVFAFFCLQRTCEYSIRFIFKSIEIELHWSYDQSVHDTLLFYFMTQDGATISFI